MVTPPRRVPQNPVRSCRLLISCFLPPPSENPSTPRLVGPLGHLWGEEGGGGGGLCFSLIPSEPWIGWRSRDGELMLGLPDHFCLWTGVIPREETASREPPAEGHKMPWASKQGKWDLWDSGRGDWLKKAWAGGGGILAELSEAGWRCCWPGMKAGWPRLKYSIWLLFMRQK